MQPGSQWSSREPGVNACGSINCRLLSVERFLASWYSKEFICHVFMMKKRWFVYFGEGQTESVPIQRTNSQRYFFVFKHRDRFHAFHHVLTVLSTGLDLTFCAGTVSWHRGHLNIYNRLHCCWQLTLKPKCPDILNSSASWDLWKINTHKLTEQ